MLRVLFSAVSALRNHQAAMDVIGNNLANVNTNGFKSNRANFKDAIYQSISSGQGAVPGGLGGVNPGQIGLGMRMMGVDVMQGQGSLAFSGRASDLSLQGAGHFILSDGAATSYTRDGSFALDQTGTFVSPTSGHKVMGLVNTTPAGATPTWGAALAPIQIAASDFSSYRVQPNGQVIGVAAPGNTVGGGGGVTAGTEVVIAKLRIAVFPNPDGLNRIGANQFLPSTASGVAAVTDAQSAGAGEVTAGALEMSNVDVANEMSRVIVTQRGFQANSKIVSTADEMLQDLINLKR